MDDGYSPQALLDEHTVVSLAEIGPDPCGAVLGPLLDRLEYIALGARKEGGRVLQQVLVGVR